MPRAKEAGTDEERLLMGRGASFGGDRNVLNLSSNSYKTLKIYENHFSNYTLLMCELYVNYISIKLLLKKNQESLLVKFYFR